MTTTPDPIGTPEFNTVRECVTWLESFAHIASDLNQDSNGDTINRPHWPTYLLKLACELSAALEAYEGAMLDARNAQRAQAQA